MKLSRTLTGVAILTLTTSLFAATGAFADTSGDYAYDVNLDNTATITGYSGSSKDISIPSSIDGHNVTAIGEFAFHGIRLTNVTIPNGVTSIGAGAFSNNDLSTLTIPSTVTFLGEYAFAYSGDFQDVHFAGNAPSHAYGPFNGINPVFVVFLDATGFDVEYAGKPFSFVPRPGTTSDATASVSAGVRSASLTAAAFGSVPFSHAQQSVNTNVTLSVDDLTGANAGWNVTTVASDLTWSAVTGGPNTGNNLPASALAVTTVGQITTVAGNAWDGDTNTGALGSPVKVLSTSGGSGSYTAPLTLTLTVPGQASVGTYAGTLTTTISAAP